MTASGPGSPHTALALLFGLGDDTPQPVAGQMLSADIGRNLGGALDRLPELTRDAAVSQVSTAAAGLLDVDLADVLAAGWREHKDLTASARRTLATPGSTELVNLSDHRVTVAQEPSVSMLVDGRDVATVRFRLSLAFDISVLLAEVQAGRIVALHSGRCEVTGALAIQGIDAVSRRAHLDLPGAISLRQGIRLLPAHEYPANAETRNSP
jgi:hypothetical protein